MRPTPNAARLATSTLSGAAGPAVAAILLGVFVLFGVALAGPEVIHNAAHDARHAFAFPCH
jgi:cobalt transporter subunit CbtB